MSSSFAVVFLGSLETYVHHPTLADAMKHSSLLGKSPHKVLEFRHEIIVHVEPATPFGGDPRGR